MRRYIHDPILVKIFTKILYLPGFSGYYMQWPQKLISTSTNSNTSVTKIAWNSLHRFERYGVHTIFVSLPAVTLILVFLTPKSNQHIHESEYICDQNWEKFPSLVFEIWCSEGFYSLTPSLTHSFTSGETRLQNASGTIFQRWHGQKNAQEPFKAVTMAVFYWFENR